MGIGLGVKFVQKVKCGLGTGFKKGLWMPMTFLNSRPLGVYNLGERSCGNK